MMEMTMTTLHWTALALVLLSTACYFEVEAPDTALTEDDVGVTQQALSGFGETFWMAPKGEYYTQINFCFQNLSTIPSSARQNVEQGLASSWAYYANVSFFNAGDCATASVSPIIRIASGYPTAITHGIGRTAADNSPSMELLFPPVAQFACTQSKQGGPSQPWLSAEECLRVQSAHEFGHVLGFQHESMRSDYTGDCPNGNRATAASGGGVPNTELTPYDPSSLMDQNYCRFPDQAAWLSANDLAGVRAIYGLGLTNNSCPRGCQYAQYSNAFFAIRSQEAKGWIMPREDGGVWHQSFIGSWERIKFVRYSGSDPNNNLRYGDSVIIMTRWTNRRLSARDNGTVTTTTNNDAWERWTIESPNVTKYANGSRVLINAPVLFRSAHAAANLRYLNVNPSTQDVRLSSDANNSHFRINGPLSDE
jgi:hypothetical protein